MEKGGEIVKIAHIDADSGDRLAGWVEDHLPDGHSDAPSRYLGVSNTSISVRCRSSLPAELKPEDYDLAVARHFLSCGIVGSRPHRFHQYAGLS